MNLTKTIEVTWKLSEKTAFQFVIHVSTESVEFEVSMDGYEMFKINELPSVCDNPTPTKYATLGHFGTMSFIMNQDIYETLMQRIKDAKDSLVEKV